MKLNISKPLSIFLIISLSTLKGYTFTSIDSLPPTTELFASLDNFYQQQIQAQLTEFQIQEKGKWLKYIPNIGFGYNLSTNQEGQLTSKLRPSLSFSTNIIYKVLNDKQNRLAKIQSIQQKHQLDYQQAKQQLQQQLKLYQILKQDIQYLKQLNEVDQQLFEIATHQFTKAELAPSAYLPKKRMFMQKQYELFKKEQELESLEQEVLGMARF